MPNSLRARINKLAYQGKLSQEDADRIRDALEKQVPKKPIYEDFDEDDGKPHIAICPVCGHEFEYGYWNEYDNPYCKCGQVMNWTGYSYVDDRFKE